MNKAEAEAEGYYVDTSVYPWMGYRATDYCPVLTDKEAELLAACKRALTHMAGFTQHAAGTPSAKEQIEAAIVTVGGTKP